MIDGDTLEIHGERIRIFGIDAPESRQLCTAEGSRYRCGQRAALALADLVGARTVTCERRAEDRYGRTIGICRVGGQDLGAFMVREGWAVAYRRYARDRYDREEAEARRDRRGVWSGEFELPWKWRRAKRR